MRDPFSWSFPIGRLFGIAIRIHILFPVFALAMYLRVVFDKDSEPGMGLDMLVIFVLLFVSVLLHEFGHCYGARLMDGDATEVLLWPLGGLAAVDVPHTPRANFITAAAGPAVNLLLCLAAALTLVAFSFVPSFDPRAGQLWDTVLYNWSEGVEYGSRYANMAHSLEPWQVLVARFFWLNWFGFLLNVLLIGFPLDGGRMFQCILWPRLGYRRATFAAVVAGFIVMFIVGIFSLVIKDPLPLCLAAFIYVACKQQWFILEHGGEESVFGYDFSQGYTSLERDEPPPPRKRRPSFWQRWLQRRAARKLQLEIERREAEERRMDELLEKIQREGKQALTDEENRFLKRVADKYRNRQ
jgi:Zn-dependent protease